MTAATIGLDVGIVVALALEADPIRDRLAQRSRIRGAGFELIAGRWHDLDIGLIVSGPGRERARLATDRLHAGHRPTWTIAAGLAGGLDPTLRVGDALIADEVRDLNANRFRIPFALSDDLAKDHGGGRLVAGSLLTVDRIVASPEAKAELHASTSASAVDMESWAIADLCVGRGARFLAVRAISDAAEDPVPPEVATLLGPTEGYRWGATFGALWKRPAIVGDLWALRERAVHAADRLAKALDLVVRHLNDEHPRDASN